MSEPSDVDKVLANLKTRLRDGREFSEIAAYFHDHVVPTPGFVEAAQPGHDEVLEQVLGILFKQKFPKDPVARQLLLRVAAAGFWHGHIQCQRGMAIVIYFEDIMVGLCTYAPSLSSTNTEYVRFSTAAVHGGAANTTHGPRGVS